MGILLLFSIIATFLGIVASLLTGAAFALILQEIIRRFDTRHFRMPTTTLRVIIIFAMITGSAVAEVNVGVSVDKDGVKGFYLAIGEHYQVTEKEVVVIKKKSVPDEDLPVAFHIAEHAGVPHTKVINLRLKGMSWMDITHHFGLTAEIFYVSVKRKPGPPYGKAWGHFKKGKNKGWKNVNLTDPDIVNYVNMKFICDRYGYTPDDVIRMRAKGDSFVGINTKVKKAKNKKKAHKMASNDSKPKPKKKGCLKKK